MKSESNMNSHDKHFKLHNFSIQDIKKWPQVCQLVSWIDVFIVTHIRQDLIFSNLFLGINSLTTEQDTSSLKD